jgi:hypothetical protein
VWLIRRVLDWMIWFINTFTISLKYKQLK